MKKHTDVGFKVCLPLKDNLGMALTVVRHHHEKLDGTGYPDALRGDQIPMVARIMAVVEQPPRLNRDTRPPPQLVELAEGFEPPTC